MKYKVKQWELWEKIIIHIVLIVFNVMEIYLQKWRENFNRVGEMLIVILVMTRPLIKWGIVLGVQSQWVEMVLKRWVRAEKVGIPIL